MPVRQTADLGRDRAPPGRAGKLARAGAGPLVAAGWPRGRRARAAGAAAAPGRWPGAGRSGSRTGAPAREAAGGPVIDKCR